MNVVEIKLPAETSKHQRAEKKNPQKKGLVFYFCNKIRPGKDEVRDWVVSQRMGGWQKPPSFSVDKTNEGW